MQITVKTVPQAQRKTPPAKGESITFGRKFTDHMFQMRWSRSQGWFDPVIQPYQPISLDPSAIILHYGHQAFEGMKAYCSASNKKLLFRPQDNFKRMNLTAERMCLPQIDGEFVLQTLKQLIKLDEQWVPSEIGTSLYIRPALFATEPVLGLKTSDEFLFIIIMCSVGAYYSKGFSPVSITTVDQYTRAAQGGTGEAKTAGNYAGTVLAEKQAKEAGFDQVLWLDAKERRYLEEVGSMNIFLMRKGQLITPTLTGSVLPGITRKSVIELASGWGIEVKEEPISIEETIEGIQNGDISEVFGSGTAAVISSVGGLQHQGKSYPINNQRTGKLAERLFKALTAIQHGEGDDPFGWREWIS